MGGLEIIVIGKIVVMVSIFLFLGQTGIARGRWSVLGHDKGVGRSMVSWEKVGRKGGLKERRERKD